MSRRRRPVWPLAALLILVIAGLGAGFALLPGQGVAPAPQKADVAPATPPEAPLSPTDHAFQRHFLDSLAFMRDGRLQEAEASLRSALDINSHVPEAHANLGFVLYEQKRYAEAQEQFEYSIEINDREPNAYWGLALTYEKLGELEAAVGAMRTFWHMVPQESPFHRKAAAALWEWETILKVRRGQIPVGPDLKLPKPQFGAPDLPPPLGLEPPQPPAGFGGGGQ